MSTTDKTRWAIICAAVIAAVAYTVFAVWAIFINKYDEPQIYNMRFLERWDASYFGKGGTRIQDYKGYWKEEKSGNVLTLSIDSYMMYKMHLGEVVPMSFKPSRMGLQESHDGLYAFFPRLWLLMLSLLSIIAGGFLGCSWLFSFDNKDQCKDIYGS